MYIERLKSYANTLITLVQKILAPNKTLNLLHMVPSTYTIGFYGLSIMVLENGTFPSTGGLLWTTGTNSLFSSTGGLLWTFFIFSLKFSKYKSPIFYYPSSHQPEVLCELLAQIVYSHRPGVSCGHFLFSLWNSLSTNRPFPGRFLSSSNFLNNKLIWRDTKIISVR